MNALIIPSMATDTKTSGLSVVLAARGVTRHTRMANGDMLWRETESASAVFDSGGRSGRPINQVIDAAAPAAVGDVALDLPGFSTWHSSIEQQWIV